MIEKLNPNDMSYSQLINNPLVRELSKTDSVVREILNDIDVIKAMRSEVRRERENELNLILNSEYTFSIIYYSTQKNLLGLVDTFRVEGGKNAQLVLDLKMEYNVGISEIRISRGGKRIKKITFSENEFRTKKYKSIKLFNL
jgi:hypothetical protein